MRDRVTVVTPEDTTEDAVLADADVVVAASLGQAPAPGLIVRALGAGAVPVVTRLPVYEELLGDGDLGLRFEAGDVDVLAAQLERLGRDGELLRSLGEGVRGGARRARVGPGRRRGRGDLRRAGGAPAARRAATPSCGRGCASASSSTSTCTCTPTTRTTA